jgi:hypothetical protein
MKERLAELREAIAVQDARLAASLERLDRSIPLPVSATTLAALVRTCEAVGGYVKTAAPSLSDLVRC